MDDALARPFTSPLLRDDELALLPPPVARYVRLSGAVGQPRVHNVRVRFRGALRKSATARWMPMTVEQYNHYDQPSRFFFLRATLFGIPFEAFHRYVGTAATMRVKVASLFTVVNASGPEMNTAETVTLLNDMCLLAPGTLVDPHITWESVDDHTVRATFTNAGNRVNATLVFNAAGELETFWSDDRWELSADGKSFTRQRWRTPMHGYQAFGAHRLARYGEARYEPLNGNADDGFAYATFDLQDVAYNVTSR